MDSKNNSMANVDANEILKQIKNILICPVCIEGIKILPIFQCINGHVTCKNCIPKCENCPVCRNNHKPVRNLKLEEIVTKIEGLQPENQDGLDEQPKILEWKKKPMRGIVDLHLVVQEFQSRLEENLRGLIARAGTAQPQSQSHGPRLVRVQPNTERPLRPLTRSRLEEIFRETAQPLGQSDGSFVRAHPNTRRTQTRPRSRLEESLPERLRAQAGTIQAQRGIATSGWTVTNMRDQPSPENLRANQIRTTQSNWTVTDEIRTEQSQSPLTRRTQSHGRMRHNFSHPRTGQPQDTQVRTTQSGWTETAVVHDQSRRSGQSPANQIRTTQSGWTVTNKTKNKT